jgi:drug/metabolite transporter (DMT)-like permease
VWILLATILYGFNINIVGHYLKDINPIHLATVSIAAMIIPTGIVLWQQNFLQLPFDDDPTLLSVINSVLLGVTGTAIATALFYVLVKKAGGLFASLVTYGIPFVALAWGFVFGEKITALQIGCLMIILCGVYLANLVDRKKLFKSKISVSKINRRLKLDNKHVQDEITPIHLILTRPLFLFLLKQDACQLLK